MPSIPLHCHPNSTPNQLLDNPLPELLQTPAGLAVLELQGTINFPSPETDGSEDQQSQNEGEEQDGQPPTTFETPLGKLMFPDYSLQNSKDDTSWMKEVYLYVGRYQRMVGQVKKMAKPIAVVQRRGETDELEVLDIVKYKIIFGSRPEPVNNS